MAVEYAVRALIYLAKNTERFVPLNELSKEADVPQQFMVKIAKSLAVAQILEVRKGKRGGYRLRKDPDKLTVLEIFETVSGEIAISPCVLHPEICPRSSNCKLREIWEKAGKQIRDSMKISLSSLM